MGTEDLDIKFRDGDEYETNFSKVEGAIPTQETYNILWSDTDEAIYEMGVNRSTPTPPFDLYVKANGYYTSTGVNKYGMEVHIKIGSYYYGIIFDHDAGGWHGSIAKSQTKPTLGAFDRDFIDGQNFSENYYGWIGLRFNSDLTIDYLWHATINTNPNMLSWVPTDLVFQVDEATGVTWIDGLITEIIIKSEYVGATGGDTKKLAQIYLEADAGTPIGGGSATELDYNFIKIVKGISGLTQCSIQFKEQMFENLATHQGNHGKYFDIFTNYGYHLVKAEMRNLGEIKNDVSNVLYAYESKLPFDARRNCCAVAISTIDILPSSIFFSSSACETYCDIIVDRHYTSGMSEATVKKEFKDVIVELDAFVDIELAEREIPTRYMMLIRSRWLRMILISLR